jgi:sulfate/thiosulfate-binding protein
MSFIKSRIASIVFISLISLGAAYAALHTFSHSSVHDPARELYADLNDAFATHWKARTGVDVSIRLAQSISGKPVRVILDGLNVTTLALSYNVDALHEKGQFIPNSWKPLPQNSVFLVRKGNPKELNDWNDLLRPGIEVITPDPKISESGRWNYLTAWGYALRQPGSEATALEFVRKLFANVRSPATVDFVERDLGDVLLVWENEAHLLIQATSAEGMDNFEIITPSVSIVAEPTVSVVDALTDRNSTREVAAAYIDYLYTPPGAGYRGQALLSPA